MFPTRGLEGTAPTFDDAAGGIVESDRPAFEAAMRQSLEPPVGCGRRPHWRIRGRDGVVRALRKQWFVQHGPDGRPLRMLGLAMDDSDAFALMRTDDGIGAGGNLFGLVLDVTERRLAEAARRHHERAVRESEAKSRFLSRMNHGLRTPLNAVLGFAQSLLDEERGTTRLRADPATAAIPVVGLSANAMRDDVDRARAAGIDGYWAKPVDHAAFLAALDAMFELDPTAAGAAAPR